MESPGSFSKFSGESDSICGTNSFSLQGTTNDFTGSNGHDDAVQFAANNEWNVNNKNGCQSGSAQACTEQVDIRYQVYTLKCVSISVQTLSSTWTSYITAFASGGSVTTEFCSYQQNQCWSISDYDKYGLASHWNKLSGQILGTEGGSNAKFTSPTAMQTQVFFAGLTSGIYTSYLTDETNNLNYGSPSHFCQRAICYVVIQSTN
jgi:hypothetical protein